MSTRPKRTTATPSLQAPPTPSRSTRGSRVKLQVGTPGGSDLSPAPPDNNADNLDDGDNISDSGEDDDEHEGRAEGTGNGEGAGEGDDDEMSDLTPEPGPSRGARGRGRGRGRGRPKGSRNVKRERTTTATGTDDEGAQKTRRLRKSVSYREIPPEEVEDADEGVAEDEDAEDEDADAEGEDDQDVDVPAITPRKRPAVIDDRERIGSGRGGFSVKGAAAAAARARWAKHRAEKAERGEESDDGERRRRRTNPNAAAKRDTKAAVDSYIPGAKIEIKGVEYTIGDDELEMPDDEKGEGKVDKSGRLQGGREYRPVTFTSDARRDKDRVYALTIDAARACGFQDSLAFLRRCPTILKLACNADERQMLIDIGRVTGNLKNRTITMVAMRNVYKLMGARVIKDGKWVTDDYYEDESLAKCAENGFTPYTLAETEDFAVNAHSSAAPAGRQGQGGLDGSAATANAPLKSNLSLAPFYTINGPTTQFGSAGVDPFTDAGWGHKRVRLGAQGVSQEDWMWQLAKEAREVDAQLREYRAARLPELSGKDLEVWAYHQWRGDEWDGAPAPARAGEGEADMKPGLTNGSATPGAGDAPSPGGLLMPPKPERRRSALSQEVTFAEREPEGYGVVPKVESAATPAAVESPVPAAPADAAGVEGGAGTEQEASAPPPLERGESYKTHGGRVVVETQAQRERWERRYNWGAGNLEAGVVRAVIEPHTHIPHVPQHTQPTTAHLQRASYRPILSSASDAEHRNFAQSALSGPGARGLASVEYAFEPRGKSERERAVERALEEAGLGARGGVEGEGEGDWERGRDWEVPDEFGLHVYGKGASAVWMGSGSGWGYAEEEQRRGRMVKEAEEWARAEEEREEREEREREGVDGEDGADGGDGGEDAEGTTKEVGGGPKPGGAAEVPTLAETGTGTGTGMEVDV